MFYKVEYFQIVYNGNMIILIVKYKMSNINTIQSTKLRVYTLQLMSHDIYTCIVFNSFI